MHQKWSAMKNQKHELKETDLKKDKNTESINILEKEVFQLERKKKS